MICPNCSNESLRIEKGDDSYYNVMRCLRCGWFSWLCNLNKTIGE